MTPRLKEAQLVTLLEANLSDELAQRELANVLLRKLDRMIPAPTGTWRGRPVVLDCKGAYSSGYWGFIGSSSYPPTDTWDEIVKDPDSEHVAHLKALRSYIAEVAYGRPHVVTASKAWPRRSA